MKRYLALLTLSFLSTTTLAEAVKLNILELPADPEERTKSLTAKAEKLQQNIDGTENEDLKEAFTTKYRIVRTLIDNPLLSGQDAEAYKAANEKRNRIAANFYHNAYYGDAYEKLMNITRYSELGIYPKASQEGLDLKETAESIQKIRAWNASQEDKVKGVAGYLKREKRANQLLENIEEIKKGILAEAESIKAGPLLSELREIRKALPKYNYDNDLKKIDNALNCIRDICENDREYTIIRSIIRYREVKEELPSLLENCRKLIKDTPSFVSSVLSGDFIELEERISCIPYHSCISSLNDNDSGRAKMDPLLRIMEHIRQLPALLKEYNELLPIVLPELEKAERLEEAKRLEEAERAQFDSFAGGLDELLPHLSGYSFVGGDENPPVELFPTSSSSSSTSAVEPDLKVDNPLFSMGKPSPYLSTRGFSGFESSHRWTLGEKATITLPLARMDPRPSSITFLNTSSFVTRNHTQDLTVKVNGAEVGRYEYTPSNNDHTIEIPLPQTDLAEIEFETPKAISPSELVGSGNADKRTLGVLFREAWLNIEETEAQTIPLFNGADDY